MNAWQSIVSAVCDKTQKCLEINGTTAVVECGGACVLPQHFDQISSDITRYPLLEAVETWPQQVIVHVEKSRQASIEAVHYAWARIPVGGQLLVLGPNELGIKSTIKQLETQLRSASELLINKRKARVHRFVKPESARDVTYEIAWHEIAADGESERTLITRSGVFSANALDDATAMLQRHIAQLPAPQRILDMACGSGHLGIYAMHLWPDARLVFLDADARALAATEKNCVRLALQNRATLQWWSAGTPLDLEPVDVVLMNPPAHEGKVATTEIALCMFEQAFAVLKEGGQLLIVANRQLAYEHALRQLTPHVQCLEETGVFKILQVCKGEA